MIRVEKGTKDQNAVRTMLAGAIGAVVLALGADPVHRQYDLRFDTDPWTNPTVEIVPQPEGPPEVFYTANPRRAVRGTWTATIETSDFKRMQTRKGFGDYSVPAKPAVPWPWFAFFENDQPTPLEPLIPYHVCVWHRVETIDTGVWRDSARACSSLYDPKQRRLLE